MAITQDIIPTKTALAYRLTHLTNRPIEYVGFHHIPELREHVCRISGPDILAQWFIPDNADLNVIIHAFKDQYPELLV